MPRITPQQAGGLNRCAFLDMIAYSEIGQQLLAESDDGYSGCYLQVLEPMGFFARERLWAASECYIWFGASL